MPHSRNSIDGMPFDESAPLLRAGPQDSAASTQSASGGKKSSLKASTANLCLGVLGAGQLTLPFAIRGAGLFLGSGILLLLASLAVYSLTLLTRCQQHTGANNYGAILTATLGAKYRRLADLLLSFYAWGGGISFMMLVASQLRQISVYLGHDIKSSILLSAVVAVLVFPLAAMRNLDSLKFTSYIGAFGAIYIMICVVVSAPWQNGSLQICGRASDPEATVGWWPESTMYAINAFPLVAFALNSAWCYTPLLAHLDNPTKGRTYGLIICSNVVILFNYTMISIFGYLSFCGETQDNILANLPDLPYVVVARFMLVIQLCFALPLRFHVTRNIMEEVIHRRCNPGASNPMPERLVSIGLTVLIVGTALLSAIVSESLHTVIGLTSAVCASFVIYIFPAAALRHILQEQYGANKVPFKKTYGPWIAIIFGASMCVTGTAVNIIELARGGKIHG